MPEFTPINAASEMAPIKPEEGEAEIQSQADKEQVIKPDPIDDDKV